MPSRLAPGSVGLWNLRGERVGKTGLIMWSKKRPNRRLENTKLQTPQLIANNRIKSPGNQISNVEGKMQSLEHPVGISRAHVSEEAWARAARGIERNLRHKWRAGAA